MTVNITTQIPDELNRSLSFVAKEMHKSESEIIHEAIEAYVRELREDIEDAEIALARKNSPNRKFYTSEEMKKKLEERYQKEHGLQG
ncbi:MAG: hypothetical protein RCG15_03135 [Candidatus Rickettsia vulgarisii]